MCRSSARPRAPRVARLLVIALASLGASACLARTDTDRAGRARPLQRQAASHAVGGAVVQPGRPAGTWTALGSGPCGIVDGSAHCVDLLGMFTMPRLVGARVVRVHRGDDVVCGVTPADAGVCADASTTAEAEHVTDSVRSIAGSYGSGLWCASLLRGGVRCGRIETRIQSALPPTRPPGLPDTVRFAEAFGGLASCARAESGEVWCWGAARAGELGRGEVRDPSAAPIAGGHRYRSLATGERAWCGIVVDGSVRCWGDGRVSVFGDTATLDRCLTGDGDPFPCAKTPRRIPLPGAARQMEVSGSGACALLADARVVCWGSRFHQAVTPVEGLPGDVMELAVGGSHGCARTRAGELWCWSLTGRERSPERVPVP